MGSDVKIIDPLHEKFKKIGLVCRWEANERGIVTIYVQFDDATQSEDGRWEIWPFLEWQLEEIK